MRRAKQGNPDLQAELVIARKRVQRLEAQLSERKSDPGQKSSQKEGTEDALLPYTDIFRQITENTPEIFWLFDRIQRKVMYVSPAYEKLWGRSVQSLYDRHEAWLESVHPDDLLYAQASFEGIIETGCGGEREYRIIRPDGTLRWVSDRTFGIRDAQGTIYLIAGITIDVTDYKDTERALSESEKRYHLVAERTSDVVSITTFSLNPSYVYASPSHKEVLGYEPEDLVGKCPFDFIHPEDREKLIPIMTRYISLSQQGSGIREEKPPSERMLFRSRDGWGNWRYMEASADLLDADHILFVSRDITERMQTEAELRKARDELEQRVQERTTELKDKTDRLEQANIALRVLLETRDRDRKSIEESMLFNIKEFAEPHLEKVKQTNLTELQRGCLDVIESTLKELTSPLLRDLAKNYANLSRTEIQVANLVSFGRSTKEIAETLHVSKRTVEGHRMNIRRKLGIRDEKKSLQSYLLDLK